MTPFDHENKKYYDSHQNDALGNTTFENLFNQYFKSLCFFCQHRFGLGEHDAKDIVHSAYVRLFESQLSFISEASARAYLYKITSGICIDLMRRQSVKQKYFHLLKVSSNDATLTETVNQTELKQLQEDLNNAIRLLPSQMRQVFELSRNEGLKYSEIAEVLGISIKTVETQMSRALARLRQKLASYL